MDRVLNLRWGCPQKQIQNYKLYRYQMIFCGKKLPKISLRRGGGGAPLGEGSVGVPYYRENDHFEIYPLLKTLVLT